MKNTVTMAELMKQVEAFEKPQNLDEGFASDAQRRAAFAQGYTAKGKKDKKDEEVLDEAKATLSRFGGDRLKSSIMNLAKQRGLKVKDLGKDKIEISGNGKVVMAITLAVQKKDVKINEGPPNTQATPDMSAMRAAGKENELPKIKAKAKQMVAVAQEEVDIQEDGHTDVASAIRQCKTMVEDAMQITSKLQTMNPEDSLPSWWTNKLAVSSNSMNKLRDYFLVPTTEEVELDEKFEYVLVDKDNKVIGVFGTKQRAKDFEPKAKKQPALKNRLPLRIQPIKPKSKKVGDTVIGIGEEVELEEKAGDIPDLKNLVGELVKASGMHLAQSKRVQAHVDMMTKADAKGPEGAGGLADLKKIVGELEKASEAHKRQSKSIDAHVKFMGESIEDELEEKVYFSKKTKDGNIFQVVDRNTKGMKGSQDKFQMKIVSKGGKMVKDIGSHPSVDGAKQYAKSKGILEEVELDEAKSSTGYELYHNSFANAMSHAYTMAKKIHRIDIDRKEIDDKVATGPRKPSEGKTNKYRLKGKGGVMQIQVYNSGNKIKPYELNMYKEEVELDENASRAFDDLIKTGGVDKKDFQKAKQLYMKKDLMGLRKFIYNLDTDPLESIMDIISTNDSKAFMKMYPKSKKGEYMSSIAHTHKEAVDLVSTATEILTTANTYEEK